MKIDADFHRDTVLADGTRVTLRMVRPSDAAELQRQFTRLSPGSRYRRFLSTAPDLSEDKLRYLTEVDGMSHVAIVATIDSPGTGEAEQGNEASDNPLWRLFRLIAQSLLAIRFAWRR